MTENKKPLRGRKAIYKYVREKWNIVAHPNKTSPLETQYGLPIKTIGAQVYATEEALDKWAEAAIEDGLLKLEIRVKKKTSKLTKNKYKKIWQTIDNFYEVKDEETRAIWHEHIKKMVRLGLKPKMITGTFNKIMTGMIKECGKKIAVRDYRPTLVNEEDYIYGMGVAGPASVKRRREKAKKEMGEW